MSSTAGDPATVSALWIEGNVALFVVLVISAVLLVVALITLLAYCCCCRSKTDQWNRGRSDSKSTGSQLHVDLHGDHVDADSAVTATVRGPGTVEIHIEQGRPNLKLQDLPAPDYPEYPGPDIVISIDEPPLPEGVEATMEDEERPMRLPRTEVVLRTESPSWQIKQQHQQPVHASLPTFRTALPPTAVAVTSKSTVIVGRPSHEHLHGSSIYQSDENEITIVDSDFSDYEDGLEDQARKRSRKVAADFGWETLPNKTVQLAAPAATVEESPIFAIDRHGQEYVPAPSPSLAEQQLQRAENLAELDKTLEVFEQQAETDTERFELDGGQVELNLAIDEDEIQPIDRSQVEH